MPPVWLCPDCEGVAYGWAQGPCIHCGSRRVVATQPESFREEMPPSQYRVLFFTAKEWVQLEAEAILTGQSPREFLAAREDDEIVLVREEPVGHGQLVLLKSDSEETETTKDTHHGTA